MKVRILIETGIKKGQLTSTWLDGEFDEKKKVFIADGNEFGFDGVISVVVSGADFARVMGVKKDK